MSFKKHFAKGHVAPTKTGRRNLAWLLGCATTLLISFSAAAEARQCRDLFEHKLLSSADIELLLHSDAAQTSYLMSLKSKMGGDAFAKKQSSFTQIFKQLRDLVAKNPEVAQRLSQDRSQQKEIVLTTNRRTSGLRLNEKAWSPFLARWKADLESASQSISDKPDDQSRTRMIEAVFETAAEQIRSARKLSEGTSKSARAKQAQLVYGKILDDPKFAAASSFVVREFLEQPDSEAWFTNDADILQTRFAALRSGQEISMVGVKIPPEIQSLLGRKTVPELKLPSADGPSELFSIATYLSERGERVPVGKGQTNLKLVPVVQRIDAIWKGIFSNECVGGAPDSFRSLTPERWASPLIEDSMYFNVTLSDHYVGFVQVTPVEISGRIYGSIELGSTVLAGDAMATDGASKQAIASIIFQEIKNQAPTNWSGLVVSESIAMSSAPGMRLSWSTPEFLFGELVGKQSDVRITDAIAGAIVDASPKKGFAKRYGGKMIVDATISDAGNIFKLSDENSEVLKVRLKDPRYLFPLIAESPAKLNGAIDYFARYPLSNHERRILAEEMFKAVAQKRLGAEIAVRFMPTVHVDPATLKLTENPALVIAYKQMKLTDLTKRARGEFVNRLWNLHARI